MAVPRDIKAPVTTPELAAVAGRDHANPPGAIAGFLLPALLVYAGFAAWPVLRTVYNSTHLVVPNRPAEWVGFTHYAVLWTDKIFWKAVWNTLTWAVVAADSSR